MVQEIETNFQAGSVTMEIHHAAEPDSALNGAMRPHCPLLCSDKPITQALMIPLGVVMRHELRDRPPQRRFADEDHPIQGIHS